MPKSTRVAWRPGQVGKGRTGKMNVIVVPRSAINFKLRGPELLQPISARRIVGVERDVRDAYAKQLRKLKRGL
jgi:hypothetical protein